MDTSPRTYPHGVPCWVDVVQPDPEAGTRFYGRLLGWTFHDAVPADAPGSYLVASLDGRDVAALAPDDGPAAWRTYVAVEDVDAAAAGVEGLGGRLLGASVDVGPAGRSATIEDPTGAVLHLWQPGRRLGAQATNEPGAWNFSDLHATDATRAQPFYAELFGWEVDELDVGAAEPARLVRRPGYGEHLAATVDPGITERQDAISAPPGFADCVAWFASAAAGEPSRWHVTFTVEDRDASATLASDLGGVVVASEDSTWNRTAVLRDPQGATFTVSQFTPPS